MAQLPRNLPLNLMTAIPTEETLGCLVLPGCFLQSSLDRYWTLADHIGASNTVIIEPCRLHEDGLEQVPTVHHNWVAQELLHPAKIQSGKVFPLGEHQARVSAFQGLISSGCELDRAIGAKLLCGAVHGCRI